jgi:hypothetical protein
MASLNKDSPIDNLFVEWVIVAELQDIGALEFCIPVMLGNVFETPQKNGKFISDIFTEGIIAKLPEVVVSKVVSFVQEVFDINGIAPSKHLHTRTVKDTVETIIKNLGVKAWDVRVQTRGIPSRHNDGGKSDVHIHYEWQRNLYTEVFDKVMERVEKAEVEGKSKVTRVCHDPPVTKIAPVTEIAPVQTAVQVVTEARAKSFEQWDVDEVCRLVQSIDGVGFAEVANAIKTHGIDGKYFSEMLRKNDDDLTSSITEGGLGFQRLQLKVVKSKIDEIQAAFESWKDKSDAHLAGGSTSEEKSANDTSTSQQPQMNGREKVLSSFSLHKFMENTALKFHVTLPFLMHCTAEIFEAAAGDTQRQQADLAFESAGVNSCFLDTTVADPSGAGARNQRRYCGGHER